jgi:hypothetical protein
MMAHILQRFKYLGVLCALCVYFFLTTEGTECTEDTEDKQEQLERQAQSDIPNEATNACAPLFVSEEVLHSNASAGA